MKEFLRRREFLTGSLFGLLGVLATKSVRVSAEAAKPAAAAITDKDIAHEGMTLPVSQFCEHPTKQPNKSCPDAKNRPGQCGICQFFTLDTQTTFKGAKYAKCQLMPKAPNYVASTSWCATFVKRAGT